MKKLWLCIDSRDWYEETKYRVALLCFGVLFASAGFAIWLFIRQWAFSGLDWMICFIGYPVLIAWVSVFVYSGRHGFHRGNHG